MSRISQFIAIVISVIGAMAVLDPEPTVGQEVRHIKFPDSERLMSIELLKNGREIVAAVRNADYKISLRVFNTESGREIRRFDMKEDHETRPNLSVSRNGKLVALSGFKNVIKVIAPGSGEEIRLVATLGKCTAFATTFSPDDRYLTAACEEKIVVTWNVTTGKEEAFYGGHTKSVFGVTYSPEGKYLATSGDDNVINVFDVKSGRRVREFTIEKAGIYSGIYSVSFSPDGSKLAGASYDYLTRIWDINTGAKITTLDSRDGMKLGNPSGVYSVAFFPSGKEIATANVGKPYGTVRVWNLQNGREKLRFQGNSEEIGKVSLSSDGKRLVWADKDVNIVALQ